MESGHSEAGTESREEIRVYKASAGSRRAAAATRASGARFREVPSGRFTHAGQLHAHNNFADETRTTKNRASAPIERRMTHENTRKHKTYSHTVKYSYYPSNCKGVNSVASRTLKLYSVFGIHKQQSARISVDSCASDSCCSTAALLRSVRRVANCRSHQPVRYTQHGTVSNERCASSQMLSHN